MHPDEMIGSVWIDGDVAAINWGDMLPQVERRGHRIVIIGLLPRDMVSIGPIHIWHLHIADGAVCESSTNEANAIELINDATRSPDSGPPMCSWPERNRTLPW